MDPPPEVVTMFPGSGAFHVFHPMLFQKAVDTFKLLTSLGRFSGTVSLLQDKKQKNIFHNLIFYGKHNVCIHVCIYTYMYT